MNKEFLQQQAIQSRCFHPSGEWIEFPANGIEQSIATRFEQIAAQYPHRPAIKLNEQQLTYAELNQAANRVANAILAERGTGAEAIALLFGQSIAAIVAILGVLKAGKFYIPLDVAYPHASLQTMLSDSKAELLISDQTQLALAQQISSQSCSLLQIDAIGPAHSTENPALTLTADDYACILYTSGSTGQPKGIVYNQRNLLQQTREYANAIHLCAEDRLSMVRSYAYNGALRELYGALLTGALLLPFNMQSATGSHLIAWLQQERITVWCSVGTTLRYLLQSLADSEANRPQLADLRSVMAGGEPLNKSDIALYQAYLPTQCVLSHVYGSSETVGHTRRFFMDHQTNLAGERVPAGYAVDGAEIMIVDEAGNRLEPGKIGEIAVKSRFLAVGYWQQPELTKRCFLSDAIDPQQRIYLTGDLGILQPDGCLLHRGPKDQQVKIRGYQVELHEIEQALLRLATVKNAAVVAQPSDPDTATQQNERELVAFLVAAQHAKPTNATLRNELAQILPHYSLPTRYCWLASLPLTATGKLDQRALPHWSAVPTEPAQPAQAQRTTVEQFLTQVWQAILHIKSFAESNPAINTTTTIGIDDNFFDLGGDSIKAMRLVNQLQQALGEVIHPVLLFTTPTIRQMAKYLQQHYGAALTAHNLIDEQNPGCSSLPLRHLADQVQIDASTLATFRQQFSKQTAPPLLDGPPNPPAIFVLAPGRSGTTLLRVLLGGHPRLFAPPELSLLNYNTLLERKLTLIESQQFRLEGALRALMQAKSCDLAAAQQIMAACEARDLSIQGFYAQLQQAIGHRILIDKTPNYALELATLQRAELMFRQPYYIHLLRSPYAMIHSWEETHMDQFFPSQNDYSSRQTAELIWLTSHQNILDFLKEVPQERHYRLRFEGLLQSPEAAMRDICQFLQIDFVPAMLQPYADKQQRMTDGLHLESRMLGDVKFHRYQTIDPNVADHWRNTYKVDFLSELTLQLAAQFGYDRLPQTHKLKTSTKQLSPEQLLSAIEALSEQEAQQLLQQMEKPHNDDLT